MCTANQKNLIEVRNLKKYFPIKKGFLGRQINYVQAVDNISFDIRKGETLGLVGESGCGKSTTARTIIRLYDVTEGNINYNGIDISNFSKNEMKPYKKKMQMIFQDPYASLNARMTVREIISEPINVHNVTPKNMKDDYILDLLKKVGLGKNHINRYPHEFSGGQRQRIGIARALAVNPEFIICDEPISALDVSIQAQIVNMLEELQEEMGLTYLFIAHDLSMVKYISNRMGVMYLGKIVELANSKQVYSNPLHPYTMALLSSIPIPNPVIAKNRKEIPIDGEIPSPINPPLGCRFASRCKYTQKICKEEEPILHDVGNGHMVACHLY